MKKQAVSTLIGTTGTYFASILSFCGEIVTVAACSSSYLLKVPKFAYEFLAS
jgi:hypothetical protein